MRTIRPATAEDAAACAALYAPYVDGTATTFEVEAPDADEFASRIAAAHEWVVLVDDLTGEDVVRGYAYAGPYAARAAYSWSAEVSVYLEVGLRRSGAGRALYTDLFDRLQRRGFRMLVAGVTLPNEASLGLHRSMGFTDVGTFTQIGFKLDRWWDVHRLQKPLGPRGAPGPLR
ncbi:GNAT family N-acetyltransferase [Kineococcus rhizosphaerae]|uniref:Phosphinothricin acetyltransferase n=1 Tax=Kineococcus rhizosphaerae TaxID=559628 RepID=A0A2T0R1N1_9ACTN|nr:GNAT family N-acetyltransferase [Kineococcus rhizosphaerae]PRY13478.1 phosphinothricin acetyltransferase [Kineococcus rhizosphaerae]